MPLVAFCLSHFLADFIICMSVFDFRQAHNDDYRQPNLADWAKRISVDPAKLNGAVSGARRELTDEAGSL
jgi:hypothetical protein